MHDTMLSNKSDWIVGRNKKLVCKYLRKCAHEWGWMCGLQSRWIRTDGRRGENDVKMARRRNSIVVALMMMMIGKYANYDDE